MDDLSNSYLLFLSDGLFFLLPIQGLERVVDAGVPEEEAVAECTALLGQTGSLKEYRYRILFHRESEEERMALPADEILGLVDIAQEQLMELPAQVRSAGNGYLQAAAEMETEDGRKVLAYLLNPAFLPGEA